MTVAILGILSSLAAELVTFLNKKLTGTLLQGDGAFIVVLAISVVAGVYKVATSGASVADLHDFINASLQVFAVSQVWFSLVSQKLHLQVQA